MVPLIEYDDGAILEMTIREVPEAVHGSRHLLKYSLFYGHAGVRLVGYDNEPGKGDHRHHEDQEEPYVFRGPRRLMADFLADVRALRGGKL